jgi:FkbM family methyltransferase
MLRCFLQKSSSRKLEALRFRMKRGWNRVCPWVPLPVRLPFGSWWLAWSDACGDEVFTGRFEEAERRFVENFLQPEMITLDIGAHHGFYTLLASKKVGAQGLVVAFEPSLRERTRLVRHLRLNRCANVLVEGVALGSKEGQADFFVVGGRETGCNSLRPPKVVEPTTVIRVPVLTLDSYLHGKKICNPDFIKMDVEGAELEVLKGATELLQRQPRPVILCEVQDIRTQPWGYKAQEVLSFSHRFGYRWFKPLPNGFLEPISIQQKTFDCNLIGVTDERMKQIQGLISRRVSSCQLSE